MPENSENYYHGAKASVSAPVPQSIEPIGTAAVGLIVTADDADATLFVENEAVEMPDFSAETLAKIGTTGTFNASMDAILSQGYAPNMVIVRVPEDADDAVIEAAIDILKQNSSNFGFDLKLIAAPGLEITTGIITKLSDTATAIGAAAKIGLTLCTSVAEALTERAKHDQKDAELIYPATAINGDDTVYAAALAVGQRVAIDKQYNIATSMSSKAIRGVTELSEAIDYRADDSLAQQLNGAQITTIIRKDGKFMLFGSRTTSSNINYKYEMWSRVAQFIKESIQRAADVVTDNIITADALTGLEADIETAVIDQAIADGIIIDGSFEFNSDKTTSNTLSDGLAFYKFDFGPVPIFEQTRVEGDITLEYMDQIVLDTQTTEQV